MPVKRQFAVTEDKSALQILSFCYQMKECGIILRTRVSYVVFFTPALTLDTKFEVNVKVQDYAPVKA